MMEGDFQLAHTKTAKACGACRLAHTACDSKRPCSRCVSLGKPEHCTDVTMKKRGRPRKVVPSQDSVGSGEKRRRTSHAPEASGTSAAAASAQVNVTSAAAPAAPQQPPLPPPAQHTQPQPPQLRQRPQPSQQLQPQPQPQPPQFQWTPLRSPSSPIFPSLPIPSLFHSPSGLVDRPLPSTSNPSSSSSSAASQASSTSTSTSTSSSTSSSSSSSFSTNSQPRPAMPPLALKPLALPRITAISPSAAAAAAPLPAKAGRDQRRPAGDRSQRPAAAAATVDHHRAMMADTTDGEAQGERSPADGSGGGAVADSVLSLLVEEVRELRDSNRELRQNLLDMQRQQQHYDRQQTMIMRKLDALLLGKQHHNHQQPVDASNPFAAGASNDMTDYARPMSSSPSDDSPMPPHHSDSIAGAGEFPWYGSTSSSTSSSSSSSSPQSSTVSKCILPTFAPAAASRSPSLELYYSGTPSIVHGRLPAAEILSHIPFLSCYDLDASEYPFVVDDFRKPAAVCRLAKEGEAPMMVFVNQAFCDATGYPSHELLGFPIEKISFPDYTTKRSLMPYFFVKAPPMMSIHIPCRPICVPKKGEFRRVLCRHQVLYNKQGRPVWVALCVDGQEDGQACLESALPPEIGPTDAYDAFMRGDDRNRAMASNYERAYNYLRQRGIQVTKAFRPSARIMPLLESSSPSSDDGALLEYSDSSSIPSSGSASPTSTAATATAQSHDKLSSSYGPPLPISPMQPPPSPLYPFSPYPASPSLDDFSWLLRNTENASSTGAPSPNTTGDRRKSEVN